VEETSTSTIEIPEELFRLSGWSDRMLAFLLEERMRLRDQFEAELIKAMPAICESWMDKDKASRIGWVLLQLNLSLETFKECQEIVRRWSGYYTNRREW